MLLQEHIFNEDYKPDWQDRPFIPKPTLRNVKMALNFLIARSTGTKLRHYPHFVLISPITGCNLRCPLCPAGVQDKSRKYGKMINRDFKHIADMLGDYVISMLFTSWGEPLLNESITDMIRYAKKAKKIPFVSLVTNLNTFMTKQHIEDLIECGLDLMCISVDGTTQEVYEQYRRGGSLERVIQNTNKLLVKRKKSGSKKPFIIWQFLVFKHNEHQIDNVIELGKLIGVDAVRIAAPHVYIDCVAKPFEQSWKISKRYLVPLGSQNSIYDKDGNKKHPKKCEWLWKSIMINSDGGVSPCCGVFPERYDFGNILEIDDFKSLWNNHKYRSARHIVSGGIPNMYPENICRLCTMHGNWF